MLEGVRAIWFYRLLLAVLLLFGSEFLVWLNPFQRPLTDWLLLGVGYLALACLLLDLAVRFRLRNLYDVMVLAAIYGLLSSLLLKS